MRQSIIKKIHYTLVEIMVAMAILLLMMGFLFQFTIGAQRIWSASSRATSVFDTAQVIFQVLEQDIANAVTSDEPGRSLPFYLTDKNDGKGDLTCAMFSNMTSAEFSTTKAVTTVGTYPIVYMYKYWDGTDTAKTRYSNRLYRLPIDDTTLKKADGNDFTIGKPWYLYGADYNSSTDFFAAFKTIIDNQCDLSDFELIGRGIENLTILPAATSGFSPTSATASAHYTTAMPKVFKVIVTLYDPTADELDGDLNNINTPRGKRCAETRHTFTKVIFVNQ